jgi:transcriptional regulator with XRE-family HTH domain
MKLKDLQDELRAHIRARMGRGELTGTGLARAAGFPQGHLSNFLNARRGLSLEAIDRLLESLGIGVLDLVDSRDRAHRVPPSGRASQVESVAMVSAENAVLAKFADGQILGTRSFNKSFLRRLKPRQSADRRDWLRFVVIKLDGKAARAVSDLETPEAVLLLDRHYSSLEPYRRLQPNMYVVSLPGRCVLGYLSLLENFLLLRQRDPRQQAEVIRIDRGRGYSEHIVGRVCHVGLEV